MLRSTMLAGCCAAAMGATAFAQTFTFDSGIEGWAIFDIFYLGTPLSDPQPIGSPGFDEGNGLPPGSLRVGDQASETWIGVTSAVAGDRSDLVGSSISYDILFRFADAETYAAIALFGGGLTLYQPKPSPPLGEWLHWDFPLVAGAWRIGSISGPIASDEQLIAVLSDLKGVFIHTEWRTGPDDTNVDNIAIGPRSCPGDLDGSGAVDAADLALLLGQWGGKGTADLDADGVVGAPDLAILLGAWGSC